ncbi:hypothetical protein LUZ60_015271 [Juncus effusus]|nr:hypothetical protein LUZ60_015271 [Juncus effusus]
MENVTQGFIATIKFILSLFLPLSCLFGIILFHSESPNLSFQNLSFFSSKGGSSSIQHDSCSDRYIYVYDLPSRFNSDLLRDCHSLNSWTDMCRFVANSGLGPILNDSLNVLPKSGWYVTNQFTLDVIFHNRMKQYECLTTNSSKAEAIYVPFYVGLDIGRHLWGFNMSVRDSLSLDLVQWLKSRHEWWSHSGKDHFFVSGRVTYDYRRSIENDGWGNKFMHLPDTQNITLLGIESIPYVNNEVAIPYPTYFHPANEGQILSWQKTVLSLDRPWLFSFAGARRPDQTESIRDHLIDQCSKSDECKFLDCDRVHCHSPSRVMKLLQHSKFCLQPSGDSYTRRSTFDTILSGCIPVFFHPASAYLQYIWYFPKNYTKYSVFVSEEEVRNNKVSIEEILLRYSEDQVREMRENVINMIPRIVYKDPRYELNNVRDAFDVAIDGVIERVKRVKHGVPPIDEEKRKWASFIVSTN